MSENEMRITTDDLIYEIGNKNVELMAKNKLIRSLENEIKELKIENMDKKEPYAAEE